MHTAKNIPKYKACQARRRGGGGGGGGGKGVHMHPPFEEMLFIVGLVNNSVTLTCRDCDMINDLVMLNLQHLSNKHHYEN